MPMISVSESLGLRSGGMTESDNRLAFAVGLSVHLGKILEREYFR